MIQIVSLTSSFSDTSKHRVTTMSLGDVVNKFHNQDSFSHSSPTEEADFTTLGIRSQKIDDFDTSDQNFGLHGHLNEFGGFSVDGSQTKRRYLKFTWKSTHLVCTYCFVVIGPLSSMGSPITFMMRPRASFSDLSITGSGTISANYYSPLERTSGRPFWAPRMGTTANIHNWRRKRSDSPRSRTIITGTVRTKSVKRSKTSTSQKTQKLLADHSIYLHLYFRNPVWKWLSWTQILRRTEETN